MKKIIQWLARVFGADITVTKYITVEKTVEVPVDKIVEIPKYLGGAIEGDVNIDGDLIVKGSLSVSGTIACLGKCKK